MHVANNLILAVSFGFKLNSNALNKFPFLNTHPPPLPLLLLHM